MKTTCSDPLPGTGLARGLALLLVGGLAAMAQSTAPAKDFTKAGVDIGIVVRDAAKSARFYTEALGLTEVKGFSVTPELGRKIGLIDGHAVDIRVFAVGEGDANTRLKIMSFASAPGKPADQSYIHTTLGIRYLTLFVGSTDKALERLKKAGVTPIGETPLALGPNSRITVVRDPDGNLIELIGP